MVKRARLTPEARRRIGKKTAGAKQPVRANTTHDKEAPAGKGSEYSVGRNKTPKDTRFRKGDGRPRRGRPKGSKNMVTLLLEAARDQLTVSIDGKPRR